MMPKIIPKIKKQKERENNRLKHYSNRSKIRTGRIVSVEISCKNRQTKTNAISYRQFFNPACNIEI